MVPGGAPIKSEATVGLFDAGDFIAGIGPGDVGTNVAHCLKLVLLVQASDLAALGAPARRWDIGQCDFGDLPPDSPATSRHAVDQSEDAGAVRQGR